jgi:uncharacterized protein (TIGR02391 family)
MEQLNKNLEDLWKEISYLRFCINKVRKYRSNKFYLDKEKETILEINKFYIKLKSKLSETKKRSLIEKFEELQKNISILILPDETRENKLKTIEKLEFFWPQLEIEIEKTDEIETPELFFDKLHLHPRIKKHSEKLFKNKHYAQAIFEAFKSIENFVRDKSHKKRLYGANLMFQVFDETKPILKLNKEEQKGFKFLFAGSMMGIRDPKAHKNIIQKDPYKTLEYLSLASLLMKKVEESKKM